jgi:hypothetical protein
MAKICSPSVTGTTGRRAGAGPAAADPARVRCSTSWRSTSSSTQQRRGGSGHRSAPRRSRPGRFRSPPTRTAPEHARRCSTRRSRPTNARCDTPVASRQAASPRLWPTSPIGPGARPPGRRRPGRGEVAEVSRQAGGREVAAALTQPGEVEPQHRFPAEAFALVRPYMVGATGFEPVTSAGSANHREPLCSAPFSQVRSDRRRARETLS